jgi:hypothetical protein
MTDRLCEGSLFPGGIREEDTSGAEAHVDLGELVAGMNPRSAG